MRTVHSSTSGRLASYFLRYKTGLITCFACIVVFALLDAGMIYFVQPLIDNGLAKSNANVLKVGALLVIVIFALRGIASFGANYCTAWLSGKVIYQLRQQSFEHLLRLPVSFHDHHAQGPLISKITYDTEQIAHASTHAIATLIRETLIIFVLLAIMLHASWALSLLFLVLTPLIGVILKMVSRRFKKVSQGMQTTMGGITQHVEQSLKSHKVILANGTFAVESQRFERINQDNRRQVMRFNRVSAISNPVIQLIGASAIAVVLVLASVESLLAELTPGSFTAILVAMGSLLKPLKQISKVNEQLQRGLTAAKSVFELLDTPTEKDPGRCNFLSPLTHIHCTSLSFRYPNAEQNTISDIDFELQTGQTLALVGQSGSGKSTLVNLLLGFYRPIENTLLLNGCPIEDYQLSALRSQFALVSQEIVLFNASIADNISYGCHQQVTRAQIEQAAIQAYVTEFSEKLAQGLDTRIGENGTLLSGGQKQRIAIARALLRNAPVLIFDEATSALDNQSEAKVQAAIRSVAQQRCCILIAHRLSTVKHADSILVMERGQVVERGNHQTLMSLGGTYFSLYQHSFQQNSHTSSQQKMES